MSRQSCGQCMIHDSVVCLYTKLHMISDRQLALMNLSIEVCILLHMITQFVRFVRFVRFVLFVRFVPFVPFVPFVQFAHFIHWKNIFRQKSKVFIIAFMYLLLHITDAREHNYSNSFNISESISDPNSINNSANNSANNSVNNSESKLDPILLHDVYTSIFRLRDGSTLSNVDSTAIDAMKGNVRRILAAGERDGDLLNFARSLPDDRLLGLLLLAVAGNFTVDQSPSALPQRCGIVVDPGTGVLMLRDNTVAQSVILEVLLIVSIVCLLRAWGAPISSPKDAAKAGV